ncbi:MAG: hypothetical protein ACAH80_03290 [Alphaproteobacteria bacterium]
MTSANPDRKIYRSLAFTVMKDGVEHVVFWTVDPCYFSAGKAYVRENDMDPKYSVSKVVSEELPELEALRKIQQFEDEAAAKYPLATPGYENHRWMTETCRNAPPWREHPAIEKDQTRQKLDALKAKKPSFKLK